MLVTGTLALEIDIMRRVIVATLALFPALLHAQATSPAQPQSTGSSTSLQSSLVQPAELGRSSDDAAAPLRISTGVNAPKLIHTVDVESDSDTIFQAATTDKKVVVEMLVDESGKPSDIKVVGSLAPVMERNVLAAVSQFRFTPGTLDNQPAAVPVDLEITLHSTLR
jgi:TonB family protein